MSPAMSMAALQSVVLCAGVPHAVWLRSAECIEHDVDVADHGNEEGMLNANLVGDRSLNQRQDCTADDRHIQKAGSAGREGPEFGHAKAEYAREHDRVEESDRENA